MVQVARVEQPEQRYVTDGTHVYPYNEHLDELIEREALKFCKKPDKPLPRMPRVLLVPNEPVMDDVQHALSGGLDADDEPKAP